VVTTTSARRHVINQTWKTSSSSRSSTFLYSSLPPPIPEEEDNVQYSGDIDWDGEWKKVVQQQQQQKVDRPGKDFYKSEAEIAAIRAANAATEEANRLMMNASSNIPELPRWEAVKGDWKVRRRDFPARSVAKSICSFVLVITDFLVRPAYSTSIYLHTSLYLRFLLCTAQFWVGVLAALSFGGALLSAVSAPTDVVLPSDSNGSPGSYFI
jgi:hypothetical protein